MPLYEYRCAACGKTFEILRRFQDTDLGLKCPKCLSEEIERIISSFATGGCGGGTGRGFT